MSRAGKARNMTTSTSRPTRNSTPSSAPAMYIKLNDLVAADNYIQPLLRRPKVSAVVSNLRVPLSGWDNDLWQIANWYKET